MGKKLVCVVLCFSMVLFLATPLSAATHRLGDASSSNTYQDVLQSAFDAVDLSTALNMSRGRVGLCEMEFISDSLSPVQDVVNQLLEVVDFDSLPDGRPFIFDAIHHPFFENISVELYRDGYIKTTTVSVSVCVDNLHQLMYDYPVVTPFVMRAISYKRCRVTNHHVFDWRHTTIPVVNFGVLDWYFIRDDGNVFVRTNPSWFDTWILDERLVRRANRTGLSFSGNGTRAVLAEHRYVAEFVDGFTAQGLFHVGWKSVSKG